MMSRSIWFSIDSCVIHMGLSFTVGSFFTGGSAYDSVDGVARILGKEGADACLTFKVHALLCAERLGEAK